MKLLAAADSYIQISDKDSFEDPPTPPAFSPFADLPVKLGYSPRYCSRTVDTYEFLSRKSASAGCMVEDALGPFLIARPARLSAHHRKHFIIGGNLVFDLRRRKVDKHDLFEAVDPGNDKRVFFRIQCYKRWAGKRLVLTLPNKAHDGRETDIMMVGDWSERTVEILWGDLRIGRIWRPTITLHPDFTTSAVFYLTVASGVDAAMLCAATLVFEEINMNVKSG